MNKVTGAVSSDLICFWWPLDCNSVRQHLRKIVEDLMTRQFIFGTMFSVALVAGVGAQQPTAGQPDPARSSQNEQREVTVTGCLQPGDAMRSGQIGSGTAPATGAAVGEQTGMRAGEGQFILTNARIGSASDTGTGTSGTATPATGSPTGTGTGSGTGTGTGTGTSTGTGTGTDAAAMGTAGTGASLASAYRLIGGQRDELQKYVNSRVEVRGTLVSGGRPGADSPAGIGASTPTGTGAPTTGTPTGTAATGTAATGTATGSMSSRGNADQPAQALRVTSVRQIPGSCSAENR